MAKVCLTLTGSTIDENLALVESCRPYIDLVELRVDHLGERERIGIDRFASRCRKPAICTVRRRSDGGRFDGSEQDRATLLRRAAAAGFAYIDLESDFSVDLAPERPPGVRVIRSVHDFDKVPSDLDAVYGALARDPAEVPKIAVYPKCFSEAVRLYETAKRWGERERIVLGMGSYGFFTRILAEKMRSFLTFTSVPAVDSGMAAAPGHIDPRALGETYRFRNITRSTRVFGVIGDPIMHTRSPEIHNPALACLDIDAIYVPFHVDDVDSLFDSCELLDLDGFSVTVPHKERVIARLDRSDEHVRAIGACNTVVRDAGRREFAGMNTDVPGFTAALERFIAPAPVPAKATVIGAGGTALSVVYALRRRGTEVLVVNRTPDRAAALAGAWGCRWASLDESSEAVIREYSAIMVQTTSAGMSPNERLDPLSWFRFEGTEAVFDVIYAPAKTRLLARAEKAGCRVCNGFRMLLEQAYLQFEAFTGRPYPREVSPG